MYIVRCVYLLPSLILNAVDCLNLSLSFKGRALFEISLVSELFLVFDFVRLSELPLVSDFILMSKLTLLLKLLLLSQFLLLHGFIQMFEINPWLAPISVMCIRPIAQRPERYIQEHRFRLLEQNLVFLPRLPADFSWCLVGISLVFALPGAFVLGGCFWGREGLDG